jgi:hypothetical protein
MALITDLIALCLEQMIRLGSMGVVAGDTFVSL